VCLMGWLSSKRNEQFGEVNFGRPILTNGNVVALCRSA